MIKRLNDDTSSDHDTSKDSQNYLSEDYSKDLINFLSCHDPQWQFPNQTQEEEPKLIPTQTEEKDPLPIDIPRQTEKEDPLSLDIVYPLLDSSSNGTNIRGQAHYGLRSLGPIQEEVVMVKKPYNLVKVTNVVLGLRAPKAEVGCFGFGKKRNS
nr:hypothetical protein [Tanacetum cinerariifolium]GEZ11180.1 hypothetical protein [Tanacetum cinerariifolium]